MKISQNPKVVAVIVSYNRKDLLVQTLSAISQGNVQPQMCIVVDNCSTDGSVQEISKIVTSMPIDIVELDRNVGGAGGFTVGISRALCEYGADLVWVMDDDTVPRDKALEELIKCWISYYNSESVRPAFIASRVLWTDGRDHPMNTPRQRPAANISSIRAAAQVQSIPVRSASFVSLLIDSEAARKVGLPIADYFIWNDDFEYSTRLAKHGVGLYLGSSEVVHHTATFSAVDTDPGSRLFWEVRNKIWLFTRSFSLSPREKILYGGATAIRWTKIFINSKHKIRFIKFFNSGLRAGLFKSPRSNYETLGEVYDSEKLNINRDYIVPRSNKNIDFNKFSVLLPVYEKDQPNFFKRAFESITVEQTLMPTEIVLVRDGELPRELEDTVAKIIKNSSIPIIEVSLPYSRGLAVALDAGIAACSYEIVARMDSDDISFPGRFEKQIKIIASGSDLVGSGMLEFSGSEKNIIGQRLPPTVSEKIISYSKFHDPFNHPTVMYRKSVVAAAGGYLPLDFMEDYWLFARMIALGAEVANCLEPLVLYRITPASYARRAGIKLLKSEITLQNNLLGEGFITPLQYARNLLVRGSYRLIPQSVRRAMYRGFLSGKKV